MDCLNFKNLGDNDKSDLGSRGVMVSAGIISPMSTSTWPYFLEVIVPKDLIFEGRSRNREFSNIILRDRRREQKGKSLTKIRDKHPNQNPDQARRKKSKTLPTSQISHRAGKMK